jgi:hypothetical protein
MISFTISKRASRTLNFVTIATRAETALELNTITSHLHDLTITSSKPAFTKTKLGDILQLTLTNYDEWKYNIIVILSAMSAYAIVTREDPKLQTLNFDHDDYYDGLKAKEAEGASIIRLSCSPEVRCIIKDTTGSYIGRHDIVCQFRTC